MEMSHRHLITGVVLKMEERQTANGNVMLKVHLACEDEARKIRSHVFLTVFDGALGYPEARKTGRGSVWKVDYDIKRVENKKQPGQWGEFATAKQLKVLGHDESLCARFAKKGEHGYQRPRQEPDPFSDPPPAAAPQVPFDEEDDIPF